MDFDDTIIPWELLKKEGIIKDPVFSNTNLSNDDTRLIELSKNLNAIVLSEIKTLLISNPESPILIVSFDENEPTTIFLKNMEDIVRNVLELGEERIVIIINRPMIKNRYQFEDLDDKEKISGIFIGKNLHIYYGLEILGIIEKNPEIVESNMTEMKASFQWILMKIQEYF